MAVNKSELYEATDSFVTLEGVAVTKGQVVHGSDPVLKGREGLFKVKVWAPAGGEVEAATAAPGEKRGATSRAKTTTRKAATK